MIGTDFRRQRVEAALNRIHAGASPGEVEREDLECKEDPTGREVGRRSPDDVERRLAASAACLANTRGGALVIGLADQARGADAFTGTTLDAERLRRRVWELTDPALACEVDAVVDERTGTRLLVVLVTASPGVHAVGGRFRHRVGAQCVDMTAPAIAERQGRVTDWSAAPSDARVDDVEAGALSVARELLRGTGEASRLATARASDPDLLRRLGVIAGSAAAEGAAAPGVTLNRAGWLLFCAHSGGPRLAYRRRQRPGGETRQRVEEPGIALLEEIDRVLRTIEAHNAYTTPPRGGARGLAERIPAAAVREAIVNAVMHRDWTQAEPVEVLHEGDQLRVVSPGGFPPGVTVGNLLTTTSRTRNPVLAGALRSLRLAEREAIGIARMYREMILVGHGPPVHAEDEQGVRCVLIGGEPVEPVLALTGRLSEEAREDVDLAVLLHRLLDDPQVDAEGLAEPLQKSVAEARAALRRAAAQRLEGDGPGAGEPLVVPARTTLDGAHRLGDAARGLLRERLPYAGITPAEAAPVVLRVLAQQGSVRNAELVELTGLTQYQASQALARLRDEGRIEVGSSSALGRSVFYVLPGASPGAGPAPDP